MKKTIILPILLLILFSACTKLVNTGSKAIDQANVISGQAQERADELNEIINQTPNFPKPTGEPDVRGIISAVNDNQIVMSPQSDKNNEISSSTIEVTIIASEGTIIYQEEENSSVNLLLSELMAGDQLNVWLDKSVTDLKVAEFIQSF